MSRAAKRIKSKLTAQQIHERNEIMSKFIQSAQYFMYLPFLQYPTNDFLKYSNSNLNNILMAYTYGDINNDPLLAKQKRLFDDFVKDYDQSMKVYIVEQQIKMENQKALQIQKNNANQGAKKDQIQKKLNQQKEKEKKKQQQKVEEGWAKINKVENKQKKQEVFRQKIQEIDLKPKKKVYVQKSIVSREAQDCISVQNFEQFQQLAAFKEKYGLNFQIEMKENQQL